MPCVNLYDIVKVTAREAINLDTGESLDITPEIIIDKELQPGEMDINWEDEEADPLEIDIAGVTRPFTLGLKYTYQIVFDPDPSEDIFVTISMVIPES